MEPVEEEEESKEPGGGYSRLAGEGGRGRGSGMA